MLKKLIAADGEGNWEAHFKENQRLIINLYTLWVNIPRIYAKITKRVSLI